MFYVQMILFFHQFYIIGWVQRNSMAAGCNDRKQDVQHSELLTLFSSVLLFFMYVI